MEKGCNIRDVAKKAGVSPGTVSRVLNNRMGKMQVSDATRKLILQSAKELDYQPNINARRLFSNQSRVLGLVIPSFREIHKNVFEDKHIINLLSGIERVLSSRKYKLMILFKSKEFIESGEYLTLFRSKQIDGLLIWGAYRNELFWNELTEKKCPYIFITTHPDGIQEEGNVFRADYTFAGYEIMMHLLKKNFRTIIWAIPEDQSSLYPELKEGFRKAFLETGCSMDSCLIETPCAYPSVSGYELMEKIHNENKKFSAILFTSRETAGGAFDYCMQHGIRIPMEFAIAACDSADIENSSTKISCSKVNDVQLGVNAVEALIAKIENKKILCEQKIKTVLFTGETT